MVYDDILRYLGQQNFAVASVSGNMAAGGLHILYNRVGLEPIFCILIDNTGGFRFGVQQIQSIHYQLAAQIPERNILFLIVTDQPERDKSLVRLSGIQVWLADSAERRLLIYEDQPADFYGLRDGIQMAVSETPQARAQTALKVKNWPFVTIGLIAVNVIWFIVLVLGGNVSSAEYMVSRGAAYGPLIFEQHQYWRLFTNMFMHFSTMHLLGNMVYLALAGYNLERAAGRIRFLLIYLLSGFGASVVSAAYYYLTGQNTVSAGASGAIYGLIGAMIYLMFKNRGRIRPVTLWTRVGIILIFLFYSNFINTGIDVVAHIAGLVFGILLAFALIGGKKNERR